MKKVVDPGKYWETKTVLAIPLGGIVVNRKLPVGIQFKVNRIIKRSVDFAFENPKGKIYLLINR